MSSDPIRAALERLIEAAERLADVDPIAALDLAAALADLDAARAALAAAPEGEPSDEELLAMRSWSCHGSTFDSDLVDFARAILARWRRPATPPTPLEGEVGEQPGSPEGEARALARAIDEVAKGWHPQACLLGNVTAKQFRRAAALLRQYWLLLGRQHRLQEENHRFREPERTILCDILANGTLLPDPEGTRYGIPAAPPAPPEGEVGELMTELEVAAVTVESEGGHHEATAVRRAAALLQQLSAAAPAVVPIPVSERLPGERDCDAEGRCWWWRTDDADEWWELLCIRDAREYNAGCGNARYTHWLPAHALPLPAPQGGEVEA